MKRLRRVLATFLLLAFGGIPVGAAGAAEPARRADALYDAGRYREAAEQYALLVERALDRAAGGGEEAARALFNRGVALYRQTEYARARDAFEQAAVKTRDLDVQARATYNMGNCSYREAEASIGGGNLQQAVRSLEASIAAYRRSLELRPGDRSAAANLEVARRALKGVRDELAKYGDLQDLQQEILKTLRDLVGRQEELERAGRGRDVDTAVVRDGQAALDEETKRLLGRFDLFLDRLARLRGSGQAATPHSEARTHVQSSEGHQRRAVGLLATGDRVRAASAQSSSLEELRKALEILTPPEREDRSEQGQSEEPRDRGQQAAPRDRSGDEGADAPQPGSDREQGADRAAGDAGAAPGAGAEAGVAERAEDILQEEGDKRRARDARLLGAPAPVDKDW